MILAELVDSDDIRRDDDDNTDDCARGGDRRADCASACWLSSRCCNFSVLSLLLLLLAPPSEGTVLATGGRALAFNDPSLPDLVGRGGGALELVVLPGIGSDSAIGCLCETVADEAHRQSQVMR